MNVKRTFYSFLLFLCTLSLSAQPVVTTPPDKIYGKLFVDVQMGKVFPDGKTFVDCIPKRKPAEIVADYEAGKGAAGFDLKKFVLDNFEVPASPTDNYKTNVSEDVVTHIKNLWTVLKRTPDKVVEGSSLLPLPYPYIVPGGRFREVYYWDSYFTMLGLKESGETETIDDMVKNFAYLIENYGHIPNGNRTYYLGRSQPPFFSVMVELLSEIKGDSVYQEFLPAMEKEYQYWMDGSDKLKPGQAYRRVVRLNGEDVLNRYWDDATTARQESWREDILTAQRSGRDKVEMYHHLRAAAESGIDFSSRWFANGKNLVTIRTTDMAPPDLNALLYHLEVSIAKARLMNKDDSTAGVFRKKAARRAALIDKYCWNKLRTFYTDYNWKTKKQSNHINPAGMYPFCFINEHPDYMSFLGVKVAGVIREKLLRPGGVVTTEFNTGEQWDAPNGWAPLEWMVIWGLDRCGQQDLAADIAARWVKLNEKVYKETGKLMEKYNVEDINKDAGGGEYPGQDGFGWTNGVLLKLIKKYNLPKE
ncbi:MAG TPA: alpha,alpha-trehalase TreF [Puia sp.]|nr:alpha,alpha-trehalase TreF [Puia sp.]